MVAGVKLPGIGSGFRILIDFRELSFCGPCGLGQFNQSSCKKSFKTIHHYPQTPNLREISTFFD